MKYVSRFLSIGLLMAMCALGGRGTIALAAEGEEKSPAEQLEALQEVVTDPEGAIQTTVSDVNKMKKISLSGYVQVRYENVEKGAAVGTGNKNTFLIRRARLKAAAKPVSHTGITLQADFGGSEVTLKDAYIDWFPMAAEVGQSFVLTAGQTKWPFGYQVVQSSSVRETPERAQVIRRLFPGERDRGVVVTTPTDKALWAQVGLFNGTGTEKRTGDIIPNDNNNTKDWVGRVRWSPMSNLDLGASAYLGTTVGRINAAGGSAGSGFVDENGNGVRDEGEPAIIIPGSAAVSAIEANKTRFGGDLQFWPMDGLAIKGEYVAGKQFVSAAEPEKNVQGWYALATYNVLPKTQLVGMFDTYRDGTAANSNDIWHVGVNHYLTNALRARLFYQFIEEQIGAKKKNNIVQAELIALF